MFRPTAYLVAAIVLVCLPWSTQGHAQSIQTSPLGINLAGVSYWSPEQPFLDNFKTAYSASPGGWLTQGSGKWNTGEEQYVPLDANGWPTCLCRSDAQPAAFNALGVLLFRDFPRPYYPSGQYVVLYVGEGTIIYSFDAVKNMNLSSPGRDVIDVANPSTSGIWLQITSTDPNHTGNYIRNIRVVNAQYESVLTSGGIFNPTLIALIAPFRGLRFMDWMSTNSSTQVAWSDRPQVTNAFWGVPGKGVPIEIMVSLANQIVADTWFNMPHQATDDYIKQFANYVHQNLGKNQNVYVEYSNEFWNGLFPQQSWMQQQGHAVWPSQPVNFTLTANYYGMRAAQICDIWKSVWGSEASRITCVMGQQTVNTGVAQIALACMYWNQNPCAGNHGVGALAITGYFGPPGPIPTSWLSQADGGLTSLYNAFMTGGDPNAPNGYIAYYIRAIEANQSLADSYALKMVGYEGGPALQSFDPLTAKLFTAFATDERMQTVYTAFLNQWKAAGYLQTMHHFNDVMAPAAQYGLWGAVTNVMDNSAPKYKALTGFIATSPCWWSGCFRTMMVLSRPDAPITTSSTIGTLRSSSQPVGGGSRIAMPNNFTTFGGSPVTTAYGTPNTHPWVGTAGRASNTSPNPAPLGAPATPAMGTAFGASDAPTPPTVSIASPANGTALRGNGNERIEVSATSPTGISSLTIMSEGRILERCFKATSCSATWLGTNTLVSGTRIISAIAIDTTGNRTSTSVMIEDLK